MDDRITIGSDLDAGQAVEDGLADHEEEAEVLAWWRGLAPAQRRRESGVPQKVGIGPGRKEPPEGRPPQPANPPKEEAP